MNLLAGKRALVIGAGSGIGAATARLFAQHGARVAVADIDAQGLAATAADLGGAPGWQVDITDADAVRATVDAAAAALGGLDIALNTPFIAGHPDLLGLTPEQFRREWEVLAAGTLYTFQAAIPHLKATGGGVLLTTSSALFGDYGAYAHPAIIPAYGAAKGAQEMLVKTTAMLHARDGIRVCAVQPGFTVTPGAERSMALQGVDLTTFTTLAAAGLPMGAAQPQQIAEGFLFLASDYASYINAFTLLVDGGSYASHFGRMLP
jgi:NAD(P)-dependent dehydrogenase (short-subunit alcohol dehydrogenase family)